MKSLISSLIGFMLSGSVSAASLIEGRVRQSSGEPVEAAHVMVFDWADLRRGAVAQAMTDATGYFALPLASLGGSVLPQAWTLGQNYPNPFNPSTIIPYQVPTAAHVRLEVFNVLGQRVATLVDGERPAGVYTAAWDATDAAGRAVGAGVYFYRLSSAGQPTLTRRMVLLDGQAGQAAASVALPMGPSPAAAAERVYGLAVTGAGMVTYVDAAFEVRAGMAPVEVVVEGVEGLSRGKALTGGILGDVNGDGQVNLADALLLTTYVADTSIELPPDGDISLGDVNGDGQVNLADALLLTAYVANPADPSLPAGIGQAVTSSGAWVTGAIRRLTTDGGRSPSWSPDGREVAFVSYRDGNGEIYVMASDGSNPRRLTDHEANDYSPSWSPDGREIAFVSYRGGDGEVYVMASDGSNQRRLTNGESPSWSPDGQHLAFVSYRGGDGEIYVMASDGSNRRRLTNGESPSWSPDGQHLAFVGNVDIYVMASDGSNRRRLTNGESPSWSPDGQHLAFVSYRDGNVDIYVMASDGSNLRRLTDHEANDHSPSWSPDGQHLAFVSERDGDGEIYVMELREAGGDGRPFDHGDSPATATSLAVGESIEGNLSSGDIDYFRVSVSNAGRLVASTTGNTDTYGSIKDNPVNVLSENDDGGEGRNFRVSAVVSPGIYYIRVRGFDASSTGAYTLTLTIQTGQDSDSSGGDLVAGVIRHLTDVPNNYGYYRWDGSPSWSPDGKHLAFVSRRDGNDEIYVMASDGSNQRRLTNGDSPSWSPDGQHLAFMSRRGGNFFNFFTSRIYVMASDGSNQRRLTNGDSPSWSPDGQHLAFVSRRDGNFFTASRIYVMASDGSNLRRLTDDEAWDDSPSWSPDGKHLAFVSRRDGNREIYVMASDGSNQRRLTDDDDDDDSPSWSPDGQHLAFVSERDGNREIYVMASDGSNQRRLTNGESPSWSPDGQHLAFVSERDGNLFADSRISVMELREAGGDGRPFDHGDSPATATSLAGGESIEGNLSSGDIDYFRVSVSNAGRLVASTTGSAATYGYIEDSSGQVLYENDDGGKGDHFLVSAAVWPGTYYIRVVGDRASSTGAYTLELYLDDDSSPATATPVAVGESIEDELSEPGDIDYFRVSVSNAGRLVASTTGSAATYGYIDIEDSSGQVLGERGSLVSAVVEPGTYYIRVSGESRYYRLTVQTTTTPLPLLRLTDDDDDDDSPSWSPDGQHLAFVSRRDGNREIYVMASDGSNLRRLTDDDDYSPSWSPDGQHLAFVSRRDGNREIYVMASDGSNQRRLTYHGAWDYSPSWSPDGQHLAFVSERDGDGEIYVMELVY